MAIILAAGRSRRLVSPIQVVFSAADGYQGSGSAWSLTAPDPGPLLAGDVVVLFHGVANGSYSYQPPGWVSVGADDNAGGPGGDINYGSYLFARRMSANGSLSSQDRSFEFFVNFVGSAGAVAIIVLRGVRNSNSAFTLDIGGRAADGAYPPAAANLLAVPRGGAKRLGLSFCWTNANGAVGSPALGWFSVLSSAAAGGFLYVEQQYFQADGTTSQIARSPQPGVRISTGLIHFIAP